jgi:hypothetical protein
MNIVALWLLIKMQAPWWVWLFFGIGVVLDIDHKTEE